jgi:hypothetical protein
MSVYNIFASVFRTPSSSPLTNADTLLFVFFVFISAIYACALSTTVAHSHLRRLQSSSPTANEVFRQFADTQESTARQAQGIAKQRQSEMHPVSVLSNQDETRFQLLAEQTQEGPSIPATRQVATPIHRVFV